MYKIQHILLLLMSNQFKFINNKDKCRNNNSGMSTIPMVCSNCISNTETTVGLSKYHN